jgi:hypothetical protein
MVTVPVMEALSVMTFKGMFAALKMAACNKAVSASHSGTVRCNSWTATTS